MKIFPIIIVQQGIKILLQTYKPPEIKNNIEIHVIQNNKLRRVCMIFPECIIDTKSLDRYNH